MPVWFLQMLWKAQVLLQGIIDCEAYRSGGDNFDVIQAQASKQSSEALLLDNQTQALHCGAYLLSFLFLSTLLHLFQPLHLRMFMHIKCLLPACEVVCSP